MSGLDSVAQDRDQQRVFSEFRVSVYSVKHLGHTRMCTPQGMLYAACCNEMWHFVKRIKEWEVKERHLIDKLVPCDSVNRNKVSIRHSPFFIFLHSLHVLAPTGQLDVFKDYFYYVHNLTYRCYMHKSVL
jgi:hypothetical protein